RSKARAFLEELKLKGAAFGWPIPAPVAGAVRLLHFTGARSGGAGEGAELLIAAAASPPGAERLYDEVARINNEQANLARTRAQDVAAASTSDIGGGVSGGGGGGGGGHEQLEAFSRLNNELATAQRELARRNAELGRANHALADARAALEQKQADLIAANARLEALATEDGLTGLKNRRALEATLRAEVDRALRYGSPLSLAMIDVDEFKSYNDAFGHPAGDDVLRRVAALLRGKTRSSDVVARYGGEEMAVVLVQTPAPGAAAAAELLRRAVERADWPRRAVTISIGVASLGPGATTAETLIARADAALYASKRGGRNRVTVAGDTDTGTGGGTGGGSRGGDGGGGGGGSRGGDGGARGGGDSGGE
ncbi:MAG TPA: GGDEF domain-containing protein, partial [Tepidisphaeraceae bacterium]|nr:GGDEF domain-containing protein [Tepidisphaeraceae bacterium]